jgi:hypothetical protein
MLGQESKNNIQIKDVSETDRSSVWRESCIGSDFKTRQVFFRHDSLNDSSILSIHTHRTNYAGLRPPEKVFRLLRRKNLDKILIQIRTFSRPINRSIF